VEETLTRARHCTARPESKKNCAKSGRTNWPRPSKRNIVASGGGAFARAVVVARRVAAHARCRRKAAEIPEISGAEAVARRITPRQALENMQTLEQTQRLLHTNVQEALALEVACSNFVFNRFANKISQ